MICKITDRKCKDCDIIISFIPRKIRCYDCHNIYIENAMISNKKMMTSQKQKKMKIFKDKNNLIIL